VELKGDAAEPEMRFLRLRELIGRRPFKPPFWLRGGVRQTVAASYVKRDFRWGWKQSSRVSIELADRSRVEPDCVQQSETAPTVVLFHGMGGSSASTYMRGLSHKAFRQGWNAVSMNLYNTNPSLEFPKIFHAGASQDAGQILEKLADRHPSKAFYLAGVSMGANLVLKLLGEWGNDPPVQVGGAAVISPLLDLSSSLEVLERRSNALFQRHFMGKFRRHIRERADQLRPFVDVESVLRVRSIREFDEKLTAPLSGFKSASEYYEKASALPYLKRVRVPTLLVHALDDPLLPPEPLVLGEPSNPFLESVLTDRGGHVGFLERDRSADVDRFWAENRVVDFFRICEES